MKALVAILAAAVLLLAGCGSSTPSSGSTAYTSVAYRFAVTYDSRLLSAAVDSNSPEKNQRSRVPGIGWVGGDQILLVIEGKQAATGSSSKSAALQILALRTVHPLESPTLAAFRREPYLKALIREGVMGYVVSLPEAITLAGLPAFRYVMHAQGVTVTNCTVVHGKYLYNLNLVLPPKTPAPLVSSLEAALRSFRITD